jgi:hypothetical protein
VFEAFATLLTERGFDALTMADPAAVGSSSSINGVSCASTRRRRGHDS